MLLHRAAAAARLASGSRLELCSPCLALSLLHRNRVGSTPQPSSQACHSQWDTHTRCLASRPSKEEKSWPELLGDAAKLAHGTLSKVTEGIQSVASSVLGFPKSHSPQSRGRGGQPEWPGGGSPQMDRQLPMLGGFLGQVVGSLVGGMINQLGKEVAKSGAQRDALLREAANMISQSQRLRQRLGQVQVSPMPLSQSVSSMSINGVRTQQISLTIAVIGDGGRTAMAQVSSSFSADGSKNTKVTVRMPEGDVMAIDNESGNSMRWRSGRTIDVEYEDVKK